MTEKQIKKIQDSRLLRCKYYRGGELGLKNAIDGMFEALERSYVKFPREFQDGDLDNYYYDKYIGRDKYNGVIDYWFAVVLYTFVAKHNYPSCSDIMDVFVKAYVSGDYSSLVNYFG